MYNKTITKFLFLAAFNFINASNEIMILQIGEQEIPFYKAEKPDEINKVNAMLNYFDKSSEESNGAFEVYKFKKDIALKVFSNLLKTSLNQLETLSFRNDAFFEDYKARYSITTNEQESLDNLICNLAYYYHYPEISDEEIQTKIKREKIFEIFKPLFTLEKFTTPEQLKKIFFSLFDLKQSAPGNMIFGESEGKTYLLIYDTSNPYYVLLSSDLNVIFAEQVLYYTTPDGRTMKQLGNNTIYTN